VLNFGALNFTGLPAGLRVCEKIADRPSTSSEPVLSLWKEQTAKYLNFQLCYPVRGESVEP